MSKLRLTSKLLLMFSLAMVPLVLLVTYTLINTMVPINKTRIQLSGTEMIRPLLEIISQTQKHRGQLNLKLAGESAVEPQLQATREALKKSLAGFEALQSRLPELEVGADWQPIRSTLGKLADGDIPGNAAQSFSQHTQLIESERRFMTLVAEKSELSFEHDPAPYFLMDVAVRRMIPWIEAQAQLRGLGAGLLKRDASDFAERAAVQSKLDSIRLAGSAVEEGILALKRTSEPIPAEWSLAQQASQTFITTSQTNLASDLVSGDPGAYFALGSKAIDAEYALENRAFIRVEALLNERKMKLEGAFAMMVLVFLLIFFLLNYLMFGFYRNFMNAIRIMHGAVARTAAGDLSAKIDIDGKDELAETGRSVESMTANLSSLVADIRSNAAMVAQSSLALMTGTSELSERTEQQASSLEQTAASVQELSDTVKKNAASAQTVDQLATSLQKIGESSGSAMDAAVDSMRGIQSSAGKVQEMVSLIDAIAFQTNILALNAAVEAARAGEQGRGFAVVATEVRNLAHRSAAAAKEIKTLIDNSAQQVSTGVAHIGQVSQMMSKIVEGIHDVANNIHVISSASVDQSSGLLEISAALHQLDEITQRNGRMAEHAKNSSEGLEQRAMALAKAVATFKLRQGTAEEALLLVQKGLKLYKARGKASYGIITENADGGFADRDMYVFVFDRQGFYQACGGQKARVGVNLKDLPGLDGARLVRDAFAIDSATGGWVDYTIVNPVTKNVEMKTSYVKAIDQDSVMGCGVYKAG